MGVNLATGKPLGSYSLLFSGSTCLPIMTKESPPLLSPPSCHRRRCRNNRGFLLAIYGYHQYFSQKEAMKGLTKRKSKQNWWSHQVPPLSYVIFDIGILTHLLLKRNKGRYTISIIYECILYTHKIRGFVNDMSHSLLKYRSYICIFIPFLINYNNLITPPPP